jgi:hypothetical protein
MPKYDETGERLVQVKILDDSGQQQGEATVLPESEVDDLVAQLPEGWSTEEV